jgi:hypothetical protein
MMGTLLLLVVALFSKALPLLVVALVAAVGPSGFAQSISELTLIRRGGQWAVAQIRNMEMIE